MTALDDAARSQLTFLRLEVGRLRDENRRLSHALQESKRAALGWQRRAEERGTRLPNTADGAA